MSAGPLLHLPAPIGRTTNTSRRGIRQPLTPDRRPTQALSGAPESWSSDETLVTNVTTPTPTPPTTQLVLGAPCGLLGLAWRNGGMCRAPPLICCVYQCFREFGSGVCYMGGLCLGILRVLGPLLP
mgnify:FL=1